MPSPSIDSTLSPADDSQAALFDAIGEKYDAAFPNKSAQVAAGRWLLDRLDSPRRILDAGCGTGMPTAKMLSDAGHDVLGIDVSREMLRLARNNVPAARFEHGDIRRLDLPDRSLHAITAFFSLLMLNRAAVDSTLRSFARFLEPSGYLLVSMVEGDLDHVEIPFLGQSARLTAYPQPVFESVLRGAGFDVLRAEAVDFAPHSPEAPPERQLFFYCRLPG